MVCKLHEVINFIREYNLLNDLTDEDIEQNFNIFHHACSFDKNVAAYEVRCDDPNVFETVLDKTMEILDESFDHEYTKDMMRNMATAFCEVFDMAGAPKRPVPFIIVLLSRV
ncbi:hypothetical protein PGH07_06315 [Sulfurovum sp. zt1-1]|uniref:Uncharacterized protein n=1 Tax=Sulfurovum zhangzhouensis TaxID=3019067 RepID=A0ABT7QY71_9BACT|nr:hypothetical protein [Sulfurovum zhangzhouensis]MDM5271784.1 hypothetical protein [Sulfurovum zhangzhouensis]